MASLYFSCVLMSLLPLCIGFLANWGDSGTGHCSYCNNHGTCEYKHDNTSQDVRCHCYPGYTGAHCEAVAHETGTTVAYCETSIHCQNGGTCYFDHESKVACRCPTEYTGAVCQSMQTYNNCKDNIHCLNGGTCYFDQNQAARCHCATGYSGVFCAYSSATITTITTTATAATTATAQGVTIWTTLNPACVHYVSLSHPCKDASVCSLPHVLGVICPDPNLAHYCPITCGCCSHAAATMG